jgi:tetratricopeptide (TPR) repeat protein
MGSKLRRVRSKQKKAAPSPGGRAAPASPVPPPRPMTRRRKWLFRLAALLLVPTLLLGLLELVLRLFGYGYSVSFFVKNPVAGQTTLVENRQFSRRYFPTELMRIPKPIAFVPSKPPQTLRVFVFGESAAEGDPGPAYGFARILQVLLRDQFPDRQIEVINTAVTAINSHVIRPIAREAAHYSGDVWIIYMGNNEVVGPFGSGTIFGAQTPALPVIRLNIALKATRIGQLLNDLLGRFQRGTPRSWEGMEMFLNQQVPQDDPRMTAVYANFRRNLSDMIGLATRAGTKVVVSTVGSNLRDCAPLASRHRTDFSSTNAAAWDRFYQSGVALENERKCAEAVAQYQNAAQLDDRFADLEYRLGRCFLALNQPEDARRHFLRARDLDTLRFRADSRINDLIRSTAGEWPAQQVRLADVEAALARNSTDGIPGEEWFYEHVHFTFAGNYLAAKEMAAQILELFSATNQAKPFLSLEECARRLGLTDCERLQMAEEMFRRTSRPPFSNQMDHAARTARQEAALSELRRRDQTNYPSSAAIYREALARAEDDWQLHDHYAGASVQHGDMTNALAHWQAVVRLLPHRVQTYDLLGSVLFEQGQFNEADTLYQQSLRIQPDYVDGFIGLGRIRLEQKRNEEAIVEFRRAVKLQPRSARLQNHLGVALLQLGQGAEAESALRAAVQAEPEFLPARLNIGGALMAQGKTNAAITHYQEIVRDNPANASARIALGKALAKQGRLNEAVQQYAEAVRCQPDDFDARQVLSSALIRLNRLAEAEEHLAAAVRIRPDSVESHLNYGGILAGQQKAAEARAQFEEAVRLKPDFAPAHLNLAIALTEQNQLPQAIAQLREVLRLDPGNARARQMLEAALARQNGR